MNRAQLLKRWKKSAIIHVASMIITYQGGNYFKIQSGELAILIDPENQRSYRGTQIIVNTVKPTLVERPEDSDDDSAQPVWIENQGEYEIKGIRIRGWSTGYDSKTKRETTAYRILFDDISIVILGHISETINPEIVSELTDADILIAPAGGSPYVSQQIISKLIRQMEPGIIIPSLYKDVKPFLKELDHPEAKPEDKLVIKKKDIVAKAMKVSVLQ
ncbi:MAG: MBL fold metallo-hydrolase [bacterium]